MTLWLLLSYALPFALAIGKAYWDHLRRPKPALDFRIEYPRAKMNIGQQTKLRVTALDKDGNPTVIPPGTTFTWTPPDASAGAFSTDTPDGASATFTGSIPGLDNFTVSTTIGAETVTHAATVAYVAGPMTDFRIDVSMPS